MAGLGEELIVVFGAVIAAAFMVVFFRSPGRPYIAGVITLLGAFAAAPSWGVRPQDADFVPIDQCASVDTGTIL